MKKDLICIVCPLGCPLIVDFTGKTIQNITGNRCKLGIEYAKKEKFNANCYITRLSQAGQNTSAFTQIFFYSQKTKATKRKILMIIDTYPKIKNNTKNHPLGLLNSKTKNNIGL